MHDNHPDFGEISLFLEMGAPQSLQHASVSDIQIVLRYFRPFMVAELIQQQETLKARLEAATSANTNPSSIGDLMETMRAGSRITKVGGSFQHTGTIVSRFKTVAGEDRAVVEFDAPVNGMLHIYRLDQLKVLP